MLEGLLLVDKPVGWTSFDVVNYVRKIVANFEAKKPRNVKVGHTGTLDPFASGLLIILIGKNYTRRAAELTKKDKVYEAVVSLGSRSSTGDIEGELSHVSGTEPSASEVDEVLSSFVGEIEQLPPVYSAIKINGRKAYELARSGQAVELTPRRVKIYELHRLSYVYPDIKVRANVSSGTYIRSLAEDIGRALGTAAYCKQLVRLSVDQKYNLADALAVKDLTADVIKQNLQRLV